MDKKYKIINDEFVIIEKFTEHIREIIGRYKESRSVKKLAEKLGINPPRLTQIFTHERKLNPFILRLFLNSGELDFHDVIPKHEFFNLPEEEQIFLKHLNINDDFLKLLIEVEKNGLDPAEILKAKLTK